MRKQILLGALLALTVLTVGASASFAAHSGASRLYIFNGRMLADAGSGSTIAVDVKGGNHAALKKLVGQSDDANFAVDAHTQYLRWSHGVPTVVTESNLLAGDRVSVRDRRRPPGLTRADRGHCRPARRRLRRARPLPGPAALALPRHARRLRRERSPDAAHRRRQPARASEDARPAARRDLPLRRAHDLRALAGSRPDGDLARPAARRRPDLRPHPRPALVLPRPGGTGRGEPRRRPRAGRSFLLTGPAHERGRTPRPLSPFYAGEETADELERGLRLLGLGHVRALLHDDELRARDRRDARPRRSPA